MLFFCLVSTMKPTAQKRDIPLTNVLRRWMQVIYCTIEDVNPFKELWLQLCNTQISCSLQGAYCIYTIHDSLEFFFSDPAPSQCFSVCSASLQVVLSAITQSFSTNNSLLHRLMALHDLLEKGGTSFVDLRKFSIHCIRYLGTFQTQTLLSSLHLNEVVTS